MNGEVPDFVLLRRIEREAVEPVHEGESGGRGNAPGVSGLLGGHDVELPGAEPLLDIALVEDLDDEPLSPLAERIPIPLAHHEPRRLRGRDRDGEIIDVGAVGQRQRPEPVGVAGGGPLLEAFDEDGDAVAHRQCVRHLRRRGGRPAEDNDRGEREPRPTEQAYGWPQTAGRSARTDGGRHRP